MAFILSKDRGTRGSLPSIGHFSVRVDLQSVLCWLTNWNCESQVHAGRKKMLSVRVDREITGCAHNGRRCGREQACAYRHNRITCWDLIDHGKLPGVIFAVLAIAQSRHCTGRLCDKAEHTDIEILFICRIASRCRDLNALLRNTSRACTCPECTTRPTLPERLRAYDLLIFLDAERDGLNIGAHL